MTTLANKKLAVLIDADNAPADIIDRLLEEVAKYGIASVKRIYGDWSHGLSKWKAALLPHAIIPVQQFAYTKGKNATDMALVIDAMDLLYSGNFDGFCIVSSDSDFTRLASRLRESGLTVYGFGEKKTPEAFRKACDKFVYTEIFRPEKQRQEKEKNNGKNHPAAEESAAAPDALPLLKRAVRENADDLGWANLGPIGSYISKINPDFDSRLYGYGKLSDLIKSFDIFEHRTDNNQLQVRR
uniref:NYN domain-containing protein n=1 Tax=Neisseria elongata TaxID=495 RepID=UPI0028D34563